MKIIWGVLIIVCCLYFGILGVGVPVMASSLPGKLNKDNCSFNGKQLYGRVQVVSAFPDVKIEAVTSLEDLAVQVVSAFPNRCGQWQFVTEFPDLKVQFVNSFPDLKIRFVKSFPGLR